MLRTFVLVVALTAVLSVPSPSQTALTTTRIISGVNDVVDIQAPPGDSKRLMVVLRNGRIRVYLRRTAELRAKAFLNIQSIVNDDGGEQGMLGLAFHPNYEQNGYFYVNYIDSNDDTVIYRYQVSSDPNVADDTTATLILGPVFQPFENHNAGQLAFGPDGYLYIGFGDGGSFDDPGCRAQDPQTFLGKMLRIDVDGGFPYSIPPTNPFVGDPNVLDEIWALGLRNPWRYSFDSVTGDLYIGDVGQNAVEEIDFQPASSPGGENYGWKLMEGTNCYKTDNCNNPPPCNDPSLTLPVHEYSHGGGNCSVTGGYVYRGCGIPDLQGTYFFADYCSDRIWSFRYDGANLTDFQERTAELDPGGGLVLDNVTTFGTDSDGELYIGDQDGEVYAVIAAGQPTAVDLGFEKTGANGLAPWFRVCGRLDAGNQAEFLLEDGPPSSVALLFTSLAQNPIPLWGGTLVPQLPPLAIFPFVTDSNGGWQVTAPGGLGAVDIYMQFVLQDIGNSFDTGFSNALQVSFQ